MPSKCNQPTVQVCFSPIPSLGNCSPWYAKWNAGQRERDRESILAGFAVGRGCGALRPLNNMPKSIILNVVVFSSFLELFLFLWIFPPVICFWDCILSIFCLFNRDCCSEGRGGSVQYLRAMIPSTNRLQLLCCLNWLLQILSNWRNWNYSSVKIHVNSDWSRAQAVITCHQNRFFVINVPCQRGVTVIRA